MRQKLDLAKYSWALYDLASTIFSMNIISTYFVIWLTVEKECPELYFSSAFSASILLAALAMPLLGEISDTLKRRMPFLVGCTLCCVAFTFFLGTLNTISLALLFFFLANFNYQLAQVSYNSLLIQVSTPATRGRTSGLGVSFGYIGAIVGLHLVKPFFNISGSQATFIPTALLFLLFSIPAFTFIKDPPCPHIPRSEFKLKAVFNRFRDNFRQVRRNRNLSSFFIAMFLCLNAVNTIIIFMGVYATRVMGFSVSEVVYFMSVSTLFAIVGSYIFGHLADSKGSLRALKLTIKLWCLSLLLAIVSVHRWMFWIVGPLAGISLGATWVCSRTMLVELAPEKKIGQMFGIFGLMGRFSALIGPLLWGVIVNRILVNHSVLRYRIAVGAMFLFMAGGYSVLNRLKSQRPRES